MRQSNEKASPPDSAAVFAHMRGMRGCACAGEITQWRSGLIEINDDWAAHEGDNMAWAAPGFDDRSWQTVDLEDMGSAQPGWHWFRKHVTVGPDYPRSGCCLQAAREPMSCM
jgi:hypothetical protein